MGTERFFDEYAKQYIGDYYVYIVPLKNNRKTTIDFLLWEKVKTGKRGDYYQYLNREQINRLNKDDLPTNRPVVFICQPARIKLQKLENLKERLGVGGRIEEYHDKFGQLNARSFFIDRKIKP